MTSTLWLPDWLALGRLVADHLWQSTACLALAWVFTLALRSNRAAVRHGMWVAASLKFLLPFAALTSVGSHVGARVLPVRAQPTVAVFFETIGEPFSQAAAHADGVPLPAASAGPAAFVPVLIPGLWLTGSLLVGVVCWRRWRRVRTIVRGGVPVNHGREFEVLRRLERRGGVERPIALVTSDERLEPGVFGIFRPVLLWPRLISDHLVDSHVETVVAHEVCHVRRRDNLFAALHMAVEIVFWFHPLVWWLGGRLVEERERACDEDVIRLGGEPEAYAESILKTCRLFVESPSALVAGVTGGDLAKRIERIMTNRAAETLSLGRRCLLAGLGVAALVGPAVYGVVYAPPLVAQSAKPSPSEIARIRRDLQSRIDELRAKAEMLRSGRAPLGVAATGGPLPAFAVTSVKPNRSGEGRITMFRSPGAAWTATNVTLGMLVRMAFQLQDAQIVGGPTWLFSDRFDVVGTGSGAGADGPWTQKLETLLVDRFKLAAHNETRELPIYALARSDGSTGPQLHASTLGCPELVTRRLGGAPTPPPPPTPPATGDLPKCGLRIGPGTLSGGGSRMSDLARTLSQVMGGLVVDETGLPGEFDWSLKYAPDPSLAAAGDLPPRPGSGVPVADRPSIFTAVQEQLGLKLEKRTAPIEVLVIDRAEQPVGN
jgi:bla regulator protein blaR1